MKLDSNTLYKIADKAHSLLLDNPGNIGYPTTSTWLQAITEIMRSEGYEIIVKRSGDVSATDDKLEL